MIAAAQDERRLVRLAEVVPQANARYDDDVVAAVLPAGEVVDSAEQIDLDPLPRLVGSVRRFVTSRAPELQEDARDALELLTSELVTNAIIHARTPLRVGMLVTALSVVVTVHDLDLGHSEISPELREGGRGLGLVEVLADAWGIHKGEQGGKTVWFRLNRWRGYEALRADDDYDEGVL